MRKQDITVTVHIEKDGPGFYAYAPALKGLHVGGSTMDEVLKNVEDGIIIYLESLVESGEPFPEGPHFKIRNYDDSLTKEINLTKEISMAWTLQMMLGDKSKILRQEKSSAH